MRLLEAGAVPEVTAVGIEPAAIDEPADTRRDLGLGARLGDLGDMPVGMTVECRERDAVGVGDQAE